MVIVSPERPRSEARTSEGDTTTIGVMYNYPQSDNFSLEYRVFLLTGIQIFLNLMCISFRITAQHVV